MCATAVEDAVLYQSAPMASHAIPSNALAFTISSRVKDPPGEQYDVNVNT